MASSLMGVETSSPSRGYDSLCSRVSDDDARGRAIRRWLPLGWRLQSGCPKAPTTTRTPAERLHMAVDTEPELTITTEDTDVASLHTDDLLHVAFPLPHCQVVSNESRRHVLLSMEKPVVAWRRALREHRITLELMQGRPTERLCVTDHAFKRRAKCGLINRLDGSLDEFRLLSQLIASHRSSLRRPRTA